ncbi:MAG: hypothetical protein F4018_03440 [Acidobacteria bacterium]|nr:hypothetical protein [Acidobacteriota bacterium]MYH30159.1 hypothetical protein [Acidobacteriota bacterium]MYK87462.1 hypothetical protein [Acidobacteriota bacterium]
MNHGKKDTGFVVLMSILLVTIAIAIVLGGYGLRLAAFAIVILGLIAGYVFLSSTEDKPGPGSGTGNDTGRAGPDAAAHSAAAPPENRRGDTSRKSN